MKLFSKLIEPNFFLNKNIIRKIEIKRNKIEEKNALIWNKKINNNKNILDYISFAKIISSYGVIALHLNGFLNCNLKNRKQWIIENIYETVFYHSVPIFVLCIGATLLNFKERYGLLEYNKKRLLKVVLPLIGWTLILYLYKVFILKNIKKISLDFVSIWNYFFNSNIYAIFNSLHVFLLTYILIPLLSFVEKENKMRIYTYYFFLLLLTQSFIPYLFSLFGNKLIWIYKLNIGYLIYIFAGYIIHYYHFSKFAKVMIYILGILSFFIHLIGTNILTFRYKKIIKLHKGYLNLPCIIHSCSFFLFIKEYSYLITKIINKNYINEIGSLTLGPFFMHLAVNETISKFTKFKKLIDFNLLFHTLVNFSICLILSFILKKIPIINFLVP